MSAVVAHSIADGPFERPSWAPECFSGCPSDHGPHRDESESVWCERALFSEGDLVVSVARFVAESRKGVISTRVSVNVVCPDSDVEPEKGKRIGEAVTRAAYVARMIERIDSTVTVQMAADYLGIKPWPVVKLIEAGKLPASQLCSGPIQIPTRAVLG